MVHLPEYPSLGTCSLSTKRKIFIIALDFVYFVTIHSKIHGSQVIGYVVADRVMHLANGQLCQKIPGTDEAVVVRAVKKQLAVP